MAKNNNNANQDYFKLGGRERPGKDVPADLKKQQFSKAKTRAAGAGGGTPPPPKAKKGRST